MNDPNGLIQWRGKYHLFYQHNPEAVVFGKMVWGHAVSGDLVHWEDLPIALAPTPGSTDQSGCWSGCAVDDGGEVTLIYTGRDGERESVCLATSRDDLLTWEKHPRNPVIHGPPFGLMTTGFRDPCVWREENAWRMAIGSGFEGQGGAVLLYQSMNLFDWEYLGPLYAYPTTELSAMWECPNFFPLGEKYVLIISQDKRSRVTYFVGEYRENRFFPESQGLVDFGSRYYAPQVMLDKKGRRLMFGWIKEGRTPEANLAAGWAGVQAIPRELSLVPDGGLVSVPIPEIAGLRGKSFHQEDVHIQVGSEILLPVKGNSLEIAAQFLIGGDTFGIKVCSASDGSEETVITYDGMRHVLILDLRRSSLDKWERISVHEMPLVLCAGVLLRLEIFLDHSVVEVFANGCYSMTGRIYPTRGDSLDVKLFCSSGTAHLKSIDIWQIETI